jgi:hypothetical protein
LRSRWFAHVQDNSERPFAYADGVFVAAARHTGYVQIDRCDARATVLSGRGEPRDFEVNGGVLTWDTGYPSAGVIEEEEFDSPSVVTSYNLATRRRRTWQLPLLRLKNEPSARRVAFGFLTRTNHSAFWVADESVNPGKSGLATACSAVYVANF